MFDILCTLAVITCSPTITETVEITAYNVGIEAQTDKTPCISANGENICEIVANGESVCARNGVPFGTILHIPGYGACRVVDRMNRRYKTRVDIAFGKDKIKEARQWGKQIKKITYSL